MIEEFISKLTGKYNNLKQAQSSPRDHSHVHILWTNLREGGRMTIKQWYGSSGGILRTPCKDIKMSVFGGFIYKSAQKQGRRDRAS